jgi:CheY-like chemotaxis protein
VGADEIIRQTVLIIEDNPGDARLIREMILEDPETPFDLQFADRLAQGLDLLAAGKTSLVLLDLSLPDSMGLETFAKVYAHSPSVPIIVLTGNDDQTVLDRAQALPGADRAPGQLRLAHRPAQPHAAA